MCVFELSTFYAFTIFYYSLVFFHYSLTIPSLFLYYSLLFLNYAFTIPSLFVTIPSLFLHFVTIHAPIPGRGSIDIRHRYADKHLTGKQFGDDCAGGPLPIPGRHDADTWT
jgi:hypothetical protein